MNWLLAIATLFIGFIGGVGFMCVLRGNSLEIERDSTTQTEDF